MLARYFHWGFCLGVAAGVVGTLIGLFAAGVF